MGKITAPCPDWAIKKLLIWTNVPLTGLVRSVLNLYPSKLPKSSPLARVVPTGDNDKLYGSYRISTIVTVTPITAMLLGKDLTHILLAEYSRSVATVHVVPVTVIRGGKTVGET